ncbi:MAG: DUF4340 domain-containing protein [Myxococcota bacterium]
MSARIPLVLGVLAAALFAFIVFVERDTLSSSEVRQEGARLAPRFVRSRVDRIELRRGQEPPTVLVREREEEGLLGDWRLQAPLRTDAADEAVSSLLGALQWADARRRLGPLSGEDRATFGLVEPSLEARFAVANETLTLRVGGEAPGGGRYLEIGGEGSVVGADLVEALDHDVGHFRSKRLFTRGLLDADRISLEGFSLTVEGDRWRVPLAGPDTASLLAARGRVEELLRGLTDLEATRFLEGAEAGELHVAARVHTPPGGLDGEVPARDLTLRVGGPCPADGADDGEQVVRVDGAETGELACVLASDLELLARPATDYRELRPVTVSDLELERLVLRRGDASLTVEQADGAWRWTRAGEGGEASGPADDDALAEWLSSIRNARATTLGPVEGAGAAGTYGLAPPLATLELVASDGRVEALDVGAASTAGLYLRRRLGQGEGPLSAERAVLVVPPDAEPLYALRTLHLRPRTLSEAAPETLAGLTVTRRSGLGISAAGPRVAEEVAREEARFVVTAPLRAPAEESAVREAARQLARITAERFVAEAPEPAHGLGAPAIVAEARFGTDEVTVVTLRLGAEAPGGRFASLEPGGAVFIARPALAEALAMPFVDRDLLATDPLYLARLSVESEAGTAIYRDDGTGLAPAEGTAEASPERIEALRSALETLRARRVMAYGPAAPADGLAPPRLRLLVRRDPGGGTPAEYVIAVGAPLGEGDLVHVRREDLDVGFAFAATDLAAFLPQ